MKVLDLFSGTGSATQAFADAGHKVVSVELDPSFDATIHADINKVYPFDLMHYGPFDFAWASPPCTTFSVAANVSGHWTKDVEPVTDEAKAAVKLVAHTIRLIAVLQPTYWCLENPRGRLRKSEVIRGIPVTEITYCQYGDAIQKATDLFGVLPPTFRGRSCMAGDSCHESSADKQKGLQGMAKGSVRSRVPYDLGADLLRSLQ